MSDRAPTLTEIADGLFDAVSDDALRHVADRLVPFLADALGAATFAHKVQPSSSADQDDPLLTAQQAAAILGLTDRYVLRLGREGALPRVTHLGRKYVRFPKSGVLAYCALGGQRPRATVEPGQHRRQSPGSSQRAGKSRTRRRF